MLKIVLIAILVWLVALIAAIVTLSKRHDVPVPVKVFWAAVIFFAPLVGLILYLAFSFKKNDRTIRRY